MVIHMSNLVKIEIIDIYRGLSQANKIINSRILIPIVDFFLI